MDWIKCLKLVGLKFHASLKEYSVTLIDTKGVLLKDKPASQLSKDPDIINRLSPEDANRIGYMAGVSDCLKNRCIS